MILLSYLPSKTADRWDGNAVTISVFVRQSVRTEAETIICGILSVLLSVTIEDFDIVVPYRSDLASQTLSAYEPISYVILGIDFIKFNPIACIPVAPFHWSHHCDVTSAGNWILISREIDIDANAFHVDMYSHMNAIVY